MKNRGRPALPARDVALYIFDFVRAQRGESAKARDITLAEVLQALTASRSPGPGRVKNVLAPRRSRAAKQRDQIGTPEAAGERIKRGESLQLAPVFDLEPENLGAFAQAVLAELHKLFDVTE